MTMPIALADWQARGRRFDDRGRGLFVVDEGAGDAVLCIHGFPTASWDWSWIWDGLVSDHRALAPDLLGYGFSDKPTGQDITFFEQADLVEALLRDRGISRAHVLCHDYGDTVGQELLARAREGRLTFEMRSLCLLNGGIIPGEHRPRPIQRLLMGPLGPLVQRFMNERRFSRSFSAVFGPDTQPSAQELSAFWSLITHNGGLRIMHRLSRYQRERQVHKQRWVGALQHPVVPLRFVNGPEDPVSGEHMAKVFSERVPDPDVVLLEGIGHYPQVEAPERVLSAWRDFIGRCGSG